MKKILENKNSIIRGIIIFVIIELLAAFVVFKLVKLEYYSMEDTWEDRISEYKAKVENSVPDKEELLDSTFWYMDYNAVYNSKYFAVSMEIVDKDNNSVVFSTENYAALQITLQSGEAEEVVYINLYDQFDAEQITCFIDEMIKNDGFFFEKGHIDRIKGYRDANGKVKLGELVISANDKVYTFSNAYLDKSQEIYGDNAVSLGDMGVYYVSYGINRTGEAITSHLKEQVDQLGELSYDEAYWNSNSYGDGGIETFYTETSYDDEEVRVVYCYDLDSIIKNDDSYSYMVKGYIINSQIIVFIIMLAYVIYEIQRRKLEEARYTFINAMAHELKTPAAVIQNTAEYIQTGMRPEKLSHYLDVQKQEAMHMNEILNSMLEYTRVSGKGARLKKENCFLKEMTMEVLKSFKYEMERKNISVSVDGDMEMNCDVKLMKMVLDNLISNAVKFTPENGRIEIDMRMGEFSIYNTGSQISRIDGDKIFDPMYRADKARTADGSSGMGLAISKKILDLHKLKISYSNRADGVQFYIKK